MAPLLSSLPTILQNLNNDFNGVETLAGVLVNKTCGTYALINKIINDLATLKSTLKKSEKQIEKLIIYEFSENTGNVVEAATVTTTTGSPFGGVIGLATKKTIALAKGLGDGDSTNIGDYRTARAEDASLTADNVGFVLKSGGEKFTEASITNVLAEVYTTVRKLVNGEDIAVTLATVGS